MSNKTKKIYTKPMPFPSSQPESFSVKQLKNQAIRAPFYTRIWNKSAQLAYM